MDWMNRLNAESMLTNQTLVRLIPEDEVAVPRSVLRTAAEMLRSGYASNDLADRLALIARS